MEGQEERVMMWHLQNGIESISGGDGDKFLLFHSIECHSRCIGAYPPWESISGGHTDRCGKCGKSRGGFPFPCFFLLAGGHGGG